MKPSEQLPVPLRKILGFISEHWLFLLVFVLVMVLIAAIVIFLVYRSRKKAAPAAAAGPAANLPPPTAAQTGHLRAAWLRFLRRLPQAYRRSILNFEHFVVMGAPASGKSQLIDNYTDWKRQTKEFASSQPNDPDLPVYLASSEVVMELPARILEDHSESVYRALNRLWRPIFRERGPTVIAVVNVMDLMGRTPDVVKDLAEKMRGKINVISAIRGRAIEVRVAFTHLDEIAGYHDFAAFCRDAGIPVRIAPPTEPGHVDVPARLDAWFEEIRGYLPVALTSLPSPEYRRIVTFLRRAPEATDKIKPFLKALFQHEALVPDPVYGGIYLSSDPPGVANPLSSALERGPGPDPQRRHAIVSALIAGGSLAYMALAFETQYSSWSTASEAFEHYHPNHPADVELTNRNAVVAFTSQSTGWLERHPDFFGAVRRGMRKQFTELIRDHFFVRHLYEVAAKGTLRENGIAMAARRSIYYLGVIHSDKNDRLEILDRERQQVYISMLELPADTTLIRDYLQNVDEPLTKPLVDFQLANDGIDSMDEATDWIDFLVERNKSLEDNRLTEDELRKMQILAKNLSPRLGRFLHEHLTRYIALHLDTAAGTAISAHDGKRQGPGPLELYYRSKYEGFLQKSAWASDEDLIKALQRVIKMVNETAIAVTTPRSVEELVFQLELLYSETTDSEIGPVSHLHIENTNQEMVVTSAAWSEILRNSRAAEYVKSFSASVEREPDRDVFFDPDTDRSLAPVIWNASGDMSVIFVGRGVLRGKYTRAAYDKHVREATLRLARVLDRAKIGADLQAKIVSAISDAVRRYGNYYRDEVLKFCQAFDVQARSVEELRVALAQMSSDSSAFNDFLVTVDKNTQLDGTGNPMLTSITAALADFDVWHKVVDGGAGTELGKYKSILGQLLVDLGPNAKDAKEEGGGAAAAAPSAAPSAGAASGPPEGPDTLEKALSPAGKRYLKELLGEAGSYSHLVEMWLSSVSLPENQRKPFRAPLRRLAELGGRDVGAVVWREWHAEMFPEVQAIATKFPFDPNAKEEATPAALKALFHPLEGKFFDRYRRFMEPIATEGDRPPYHVRASVARAVGLPPNMFGVINAAAALSARLWDAAGNPTPLELKIATLRFDKDARLRPELEGKTAITLMYMNIGDSSVFNFNQKPSLITVGFDWTKDLRSQVGLQLTDLSTKDNTFPPPTVSNGVYWSFHHLLRLGTPSLVKSPTTARLYTWLIRVQPDYAPNDVIPVRFVTVTDPWEPFTTLARYVGRPREAAKREEFR
jgi:IcmF-related N-terminal domain